jgi:dihydrofolate reductase
VSIVLIAAHDKNGVIGREGDLPWRLPEDLKRFRRLTMGRTLLMGRKTWASLGKPLDGRDNWVLSRDAAFAPAGARVFGTLDNALATHAAEKPGEDLMVIGGAEIYRQALPHADRLELTRVQARVEGDAHFPVIDPAQWLEHTEAECPADARHAHAFAFVTLTRRR